VGIFLISLSRSLPFNLSSLLFGSILLVTWGDVWLIAGIGLAASLTILTFFKELVHIALDEDLARASGLPVGFFNYLLSVLIGVMVVASMRIVGILLVSALLIIPSLSSIQVAKSFKQSVILSIVFALASVFLGTVIALSLDAAPGGTIVLVAIGLFLATVIRRRLWLQHASLN
jgi:zinc transport system permease protein